MAPYVPKIGKLSKLPESYQFLASKLDRLSFCTTPIEIIGDGCSVSSVHATGFYWRRNGQTYLVTNWHVVTGRDSFTDTLNNSGLIPRRLEFFGVNWPQLDNQPGYFAIVRDRLQVELAPFGNQAWYRHPKFDELRIDLAVLPLGVRNEIDVKAHVNEYGLTKLFHGVGSDIFVVGYPLNSYADAMIPIWKRGSIATEPLFQIDDKPMFLVDAATTEGMSGSPIFRRTYGPATLSNLETKLDAVVTTEFVGVYAGSLLDAQMRRIDLGYAWYGNLIDEIIDSQFA